MFSEDNEQRQPVLVFHAPPDIASQNDPTPPCDWNDLYSCVAIVHATCLWEVEMLMTNPCQPWWSRPTDSVVEVIGQSYPDDYWPPALGPDYRFRALWPGDIAVDIVRCSRTAFCCRGKVSSSHWVETFGQDVREYGI